MRRSACSDVAIYKYSAAGVLDFITYLSGESQESAGFVGLAPNGALVVAGSTDSSNFPVTAVAAAAQHMKVLQPCSDPDVRR